MPRCRGRTSVVRSVSPSRRHEVRRSAAGGVSGARRGRRETRAAHDTRYEARVGHARHEAAGVRGMRCGGSVCVNITVCKNVRKGDIFFQSETGIAKIIGESGEDAE